MSEIIGVIAGTPIDTQMGVNFVESKGLRAIGYQTANSPKEQNYLQLFGKEKLYEIVIKIISDAKESGINKFFLYCNSLSAAVDMEKASEETGVLVVTPFTIYKDMANEYSKLLILAANGQACSKIESTLVKANKDIKIWSISALPLVEEIENKNIDKDIFNRLDLGTLLSWAEANSFDGIVLGCTHFPYIKDISMENTSISIIDPAEMMLEMLIK